MRFYLDRLPEYLRQVVEREKAATGKITFYHMLHWIGRRISGALCIIHKP